MHLLKSKEKWRSSLPCNADAKFPFWEKFKIRYSPFSKQHPSKAAVLGWETCPIIPNSVRNSFSLLASLLSLANLFTAMVCPLERSPLYTSEYPPRPTILSDIWCKQTSKIKPNSKRVI